MDNQQRFSTDKRFYRYLNNTARSIRCEKDMMSIADQSKSVDNVFDHEEAWSAVEELSSK